MSFPAKIRVFVCANDVKNGYRGIDNNCPLANAVKRNTLKYNVTVDGKAIRLCSLATGKTLRKYTLSKKVQEMIERYDEGGDFTCGWVEAEG